MYNAQLPVIEYLVQLYPSSVKAISGSGHLPLHYACHYGIVKLPVIQYLVMQYPGAVKGTNDISWLPLHLACKSNVDLDAIFF
jgi:hypothetical protein